MSIETKSGTGQPRTRGRTRGVALSAVRGLALAFISLPGAVICFCLTLVSIALVPIGVGIVTTPWVLTGVRAFVHRRRLLAAEWGGVRIPRTNRPAAARGRQSVGPHLRDAP
ncbi:histidine kinase OS=Streptomyces tendae OX=1932 GN=GUR47_11410 PE=4 SV=1 [Streptomyces tendae]